MMSCALIKCDLAGLFEDILSGDAFIVQLGLDDSLK